MSQPIDEEAARVEVDLVTERVTRGRDVCWRARSPVDCRPLPVRPVPAWRAGLPSVGAPAMVRYAVAELAHR
jgi:hypothetical protein